MSDVNRSLAESRDALDRLIAAGVGSGPRWTTPRAPGKWSPSQIVEDVARALEESAKNIKGEPSAFPSLRGFVRPVIRGLFFNRILKKNAFINGKTNKAMNPIAGPPTADDGRTRLEQLFFELIRRQGREEARDLHVEQIRRAGHSRRTVLRCRGDDQLFSALSAEADEGRPLEIEEGGVEAVPLHEELLRLREDLRKVDRSIHVVPDGSVVFDHP